MEKFKKEFKVNKSTTIKSIVMGEELEFDTEKSLFSSQNVDKGTLAMLSVIELNKEDKLLDLGCGYGVVGIYAAKKIGIENVVMIDKNKLAVEFSYKNAIKNNVEGIKIIQSDAYDNIDDKDFTLILSNPPYHTDFAIAKKFIEKGFNRLRLNGRLYMVTKRKQWYKNRLIAIFGGVKIWEIDDYYVFMSIKKSVNYAPK